MPKSWSRLGALARPLAGEELDDLGVVLRRVDIVRPPRRGHDVEQLRPPLQDLAGARIAAQSQQVPPELTPEDNRRSPSARFAGVHRCRDGRPRALAPPR